MSFFGRLEELNICEAEAFSVERHLLPFRGSMRFYRLPDDIGEPSILKEVSPLRPSMRRGERKEGEVKGELHCVGSVGRGYSSHY